MDDKNNSLTKLAQRLSADKQDKEVLTEREAAFDPVACQAEAKEIQDKITEFFAKFGHDDLNSERNFLSAVCIAMRRQVEFNGNLFAGNQRAIERARNTRRGFLSADPGEDRDNGLAQQDEVIQRHQEYAPVNLNRRDTCYILHRVLDPRHDEIALNSTSQNPPLPISAQWLNYQKSVNENRERKERERVAREAKLDAAYGAIDKTVSARPLPKIA